MTNLVAVLNNKEIDCTAIFESIGNPKSRYGETYASLLNKLLVDLSNGYIPKMNPNMEYRVNLKGDYYRLLKVFVREANPSIINQSLLVDFLTYAKEKEKSVEHPHLIYLVQSFFDKGLTYDAYITPILAEQARAEFIRNVKNIAEKAYNFETRKPLQLSFKIFKIMNDHFYLSSHAIFNEAEQALLKDKKVFEIREILKKAGVQDVECPRTNRFVWENECYYILKGTAVRDYNTSNLIFIGFKKLTHYNWSNKTNIYRIVLSHDTYNNRLALHGTDAYGNSGTSVRFNRKVMYYIVKSLQKKKCDEIAEWAIQLLGLNVIGE